MKLDFFDTDDRPYYAAIVWTENGNSGEEEYYTTLQEARTALKRLRKKYQNCYDSYIRLYDSDGDGVRDYNE